MTVNKAKHCRGKTLPLRSDALCAPVFAALYALLLVRISIAINILAIVIWLYGMYIWVSSPYSGANFGSREGYIPAALTGFMLFIVRSDLADKHLNGLSFYVTIFGFIGLIIMVYFLRTHLLQNGI